MTTSSTGRILIQGNEAVVRGALRAGVNFFAGYPITPSTEIAEGLSAKLPEKGGVFMQMEDEIASIGACLGASLAGARAMTATSGPGFSLMQELIGFGCIAEIPVVIVNVMRLGPSTGQPTAVSQGDVMQARWGTHGDHPIIALAADSVAEAYAMTIKAVHFSEKYRVPVILLLDEVVAHMREMVELPIPGETGVSGRPTPKVPPEWFIPYEQTATGVPPMAAFGDGYRHHVTGLIHDVNGFPTAQPGEIKESTDRHFNKIKRGFGEICLTETVYGDDAELLIIAYGSVARSARDAVETLRAQGYPAGLFKLTTIWPFPRAALEGAAPMAKTALVCELNRGQIYREALRVTRGRRTVKKLTRVDGELLDPASIAAAAREAMGWR